jgi:hypothetical protein
MSAAVNSLVRYVALATPLHDKPAAHLRLTSNQKGKEHHVTIPEHSSLRIGTLSQILTDIAGYLEISREKLLEDLFS